MFDSLFTVSNANTYKIAGGLAIAVPGQIKGLWEAKLMYGNPQISWESLIQPSINLCLEGISVSLETAESLKIKADWIRKDPGMSHIFINPSTGDVWNYGDTFTWPNLAVTLEKIAKHGGDEFYSGETMELMLKDLDSFGAIITPEDFLQHTYVTSRECY